MTHSQRNDADESEHLRVIKKRTIMIHFQQRPPYRRSTRYFIPPLTHFLFVDTKTRRRTTTKRVIFIVDSSFIF